MTKEGNQVNMEVGSCLGIRINSKEIEILLRAFKSKDKDRIKRNRIFLRSCFLHELIHGHREEEPVILFGGSNNEYLEVFSQLGQFIYSPSSNEIFNKYVNEVLNQLEQDPRKKEDIHFKGVYIMLILLFNFILNRFPDKYLLGFKANSEFEILRKIVDIVRKLDSNELIMLQKKALDTFLSYNRKQLETIIQSVKHNMEDIIKSASCSPQKTGGIDFGFVSSPMPITQDLAEDINFKGLYYELGKAYKTRVKDVLVGAK